MTFSERLIAVRKSVGAWRDRLVETGGAVLHGVMPMVAALIVGIILALFFFGPIGPEWLTFKYWRGANANTSNSEIFRNLGLFFAAVIGLGFGIWRAIIAQIGARTARQQTYLTEQGQITDRYAKAVEMLSEDNARTRTGAIYALARIAQDSVARDHIPVMEVLTEFIRNPPYQEKAEEQAIGRQAAEQRYGETDIQKPPPIQCPDIHTALNVIADRNDAQKLHEGNKRFRPSLVSAILTELDLTRANLIGANLIGANLNGARLTSARIARADLSAARLVDAYLHLAILNGAILTHADLSGADFTSARLGGANLTRANLSGANLSGATLTQEQIDHCRPTAPPVALPDGLTWPFEEKDGEWALKE